MELFYGNISPRLIYCLMLKCLMGNILTIVVIPVVKLGKDHQNMKQSAQYLF